VIVRLLLRERIAPSRSAPRKTVIWLLTTVLTAAGNQGCDLLARGYLAGYQRLDTGDGATCRNTPKAGDFLGGRAKAAIPAFLRA